MALRIDSYTNSILDEISKKHNIDKSVVYFIIDYKFKKIRDAIWNNVNIIKLADGITEKAVFKYTKIRLDYFITMCFNEKKFKNFNKKFNANYREEQFITNNNNNNTNNKEEEIKQDSKKELKDNSRLLGIKKLF